MDELDRFIKMQEKDYEKALKEIKQGHKKTCWIWYILPIMKGLRNSKISKYYGIKDFEEATKYLGNKYLREHLIEMSQALLDLGDIDIYYVLGPIDGIKLQQCLTLFNKVENEMKINCGNIFKKVLTKFFNDEEDKKTLEILENQKKEKENNISKNDKNL